jgi:hypothetical protein
MLFVWRLMFLILGRQVLEAQSRQLFVALVWVVAVELVGISPVQQRQV